MKKYIPHIIFALVVGAAIYMILTAEKQDSRKVLNKRLSFRTQDKIPYATYVAFNSLNFFFPDASISKNNKEPGYWDSLSIFDDRQLLIIVSPYFIPDDNELTKLIDFVKSGNDIFISSLFIADNAQKAFNISSTYFDYSLLFSSRRNDDTLHISLQPEFAKEKIEYEYPGRKFSSYFFKTDTSRVYNLGYDNLDNINFIKLNAGNGNVFVHQAPLAFSNYFLLYKNNMSYYENALAFLSKNKKQVVWDEYYLNKRFENYNNRSDNQEKKGFMSVLFQHRGLKWAFIAALLLLVLYVLSEMRRKQRFIPIIKKPANDSLEFVKTIGRLYFDRGDHRNLSRKMSAYFLEHIRNRYKLATGKLNEDFIKALQFKTGFPEEELRSIVGFINKLESTTITDEQLKIFHLKLEEFYKKT